MRLTLEPLVLTVFPQQSVPALARYLVIPLNSLPHYPPYNGGMECSEQKSVTRFPRTIR